MSEATARSARQSRRDPQSRKPGGNQSNSGPVRGIRAASSVALRSAKPPVQGQQYLDLYVLQRDRTRWSQLKQRAEQMIFGIDKALARLPLPLRLNLGLLGGGGELFSVGASSGQNAGQAPPPNKRQGQGRTRRASTAKGPRSAQPCITIRDAIVIRDQSRGSSQSTRRTRRGSEKLT